MKKNNEKLSKKNETINQMRKTDTKIISEAMEILSRDIQSEDGVANAAIFEASERLMELDRDLKEAINIVHDLYTEQKKPKDALLWLQEKDYV